ncbi:hypothetical protein GJW-30_1_01597 [Variibacter gotjawalensis]|uniref:UPF0114 protein GJW-30_1_01597 n=1 Tax=Variibacter gotjawalensis TaxID=1333996 RepID=A0A0S3PT65_9BRAD|nr:TIGR00645 family protein [Variibacter gotjawalensis]NIK49383.1 uncharacterized protein (TIGR00645 family) [Variibacter gotjawalensis]RZS51235.1 uncharacterized protein (TIGR00645 family) [Variibacter gotjawalensis]BAT59068.1 hypothetical protein GJW-30_1_01597 [Variibacter gotjawalensis]
MPTSKPKTEEKAPLAETIIEVLIFNSRWLMAPFYVGLIATLFLLFIKFAALLFGYIVNINGMTDSDVILAVLTLIDLAFTGNLVLIVIFSGYENFVSKINTGDHDRPDWMTKVDFSGLKQKLITSIVAISAIQVLKAFMNIDKYGGDNTKLGWLVGIHIVFVISMLVLAMSDRLSAGDKSPAEHMDKASKK